MGHTGSGSKKRAERNAPGPPRPLSTEERKRAREVWAEVPFAQLLGLRLVRVARGEATVRLTADDGLQQNNGTLHGGALASLLDTAAAFAVMTLLAPQERTATVDLTICYLRPVRSGPVTARARVLKEGRRVVTATVEAVDGEGREVATALTNYLRSVIVTDPGGPLGSV